LKAAITAPKFDPGASKAPQPRMALTDIINFGEKQYVLLRIVLLAISRSEGF